MSNRRSVFDHAPASAIRRAQEEFNESYCALLRLLDTAFNGSPQTLSTAVGSMYRLKVKAQALMEMPTEDGLLRVRLHVSLFASAADTRFAFRIGHFHPCRRI